jgi:GNAT superfamily N-acetyltransferase
LTTESSIDIRIATPDDAATVHALVKKMSTAIPSHFSMRSSVDDFTRAMEGDAPAMHALLATRDNAPVGVLVFFTTFSTWYGSPGIYVQDIFVDECVRGKKIGQRLLAAASRWGAQHGADHLRLSVDRGNTSAQKFYAAHNLRHCDDEMIYMAEGDDFRRLGADL